MVKKKKVEKNISVKKVHLETKESELKYFETRDDAMNWIEDDKEMTSMDNRGFLDKLLGRKSENEYVYEIGFKQKRKNSKKRK